MTDDLARIAEVLEDNASRATNAVQRQIMTSNAALVRDAKARIEALTAERDDFADQIRKMLPALNREAVDQRSRAEKAEADNARLKDMADKCTSIAKDAISMCNEGHPVSAKNVAIAIIRTLNTGKEVMPDAQFNHTSDIGPGDQAVAGAAPVTTADMVKDLREKTGAGMVDAKRALTECLGDMDEAIEWLRFKGTSRTYIPKHKRLQAVAAPIRKGDQK